MNRPRRRFPLFSIYGHFPKLDVADASLVCVNKRAQVSTREILVFNFTAAAEERNAENVLVLRDPAVAQRYGAEWDRLWKESEELKARY